MANDADGDEEDEDGGDGGHGDDHLLEMSHR